jgi:predicted ATP-dependent serine protease
MCSTSAARNPASRLPCAPGGCAGDRRCKLLAEINLEKILATLQSLRPQVAVIDSIQTLWSEQLSSAPGSVAQVRECAAQLTRLAKQTGITVILVGHVTKEGAWPGRECSNTSSTPCSISRAIRTPASA